MCPSGSKATLLDRQYGGYITSVDREGKSYNDDKSVWFQGRCLWTFSALMNRYGKKASWEEGAEVGKGFLEKFCTDADGRMFFTVTREGLPLAQAPLYVLRELLCRFDGRIRRRDRATPKRCARPRTALS